MNRFTIIGITTLVLGIFLITLSINDGIDFLSGLLIGAGFFITISGYKKLKKT
jgi:hypothetical protein